MFLIIMKNNAWMKLFNFIKIQKYYQSKSLNKNLKIFQKILFWKVNKFFKKIFKSDYKSYKNFYKHLVNK